MPKRILPHLRRRLSDGLDERYARQYLGSDKLLSGAQIKGEVMQPHQQRVVDEKTELDEKLTKLNAFFSNSVFEKLPEAERLRLAKQANIMKDYSDVLSERIAAF
jgi:hypothetical protein